MRECIFHFRIIRNHTTKKLRALIMLPEGKHPSITDFIQCFDELGYKVQLENEHELIFYSIDGDAPYKLDIDEIRLAGESREKLTHDGELKAILTHMLPL